MNEIIREKEWQGAGQLKNGDCMRNKLLWNHGQSSPKMFLTAVKLISSHPQGMAG